MSFSKVLRGTTQTSFSLIVTCTSLYILYVCVTQYRLPILWVAIGVIGSLAYVSILYYRKVKWLQGELERAYGQYDYVREMIAHVRRCLLSTELAKSVSHQKDRDRIVASIIRMALNEVEKSISRIVQHQCVAVLLAVDKNKPDFLTPLIWSYGALTARRESPFQLPITDSLGGQVFLTGITRWSNDFESERDFSEGAQKSWRAFYRSGVDAVVKTNDKIIGVLAVDCKETNVFDEQLCAIVEMGADLVGLALQIEQVTIENINAQPHSESGKSI